MEIKKIKFPFSLNFSLKIVFKTQMILLFCLNSGQAWISSWVHLSCLFDGLHNVENIHVWNIRIS